ncbi:preprotein translocase subunit SecG [Posidoniimonas polymericola]|uniref:Protein-export membrane protein SecG n=1 Tax=Posidoniimonas polymericola TaxID=2528002 RepID=A0A5C5YPW7_9BACT|nr:preprotein translocase subunit SecG [Posidoniimonas polymericola]TWT76945.1 preprotein translocase subunit SecG [Posidoniimonas polymericola]
MENLFLIVLLLMAVFLILLVLIQRGRGGGLAGAFGGAGGSSAFGAKAGDTFTKITVWAASIWIVTCVAASYWASHRGDALGNADPATATSTIDFTGNGMGAAGDDSPAGDETAAGDAADSAAPAAEPAADADTPAEGE